MTLVILSFSCNFLTKYQQPNPPISTRPLHFFKASCCEICSTGVFVIQVPSLSLRVVIATGLSYVTVRGFCPVNIAVRIETTVRGFPAGCHSFVISTSPDFLLGI